jgi:hypothetical protein
MHASHETLSGWNPHQLLVDSCDECEARARMDDYGLPYLDAHRFAAAWVRAAEWNRIDPGGISIAEAPLLNVLWAVQVQLERLGVPLGTIPLPEPHIGMNHNPKAPAGYESLNRRLTWAPPNPEAVT